MPINPFSNTHKWHQRNTPQETHKHTETKIYRKTYKILACMDRLYRFSTDEEGKFGGICPTQICLENDH